MSSIFLMKHVMPIIYYIDETGAKQLYATIIRELQNKKNSKF